MRKLYGKVDFQIDADVLMWRNAKVGFYAEARCKADDGSRAEHSSRNGVKAIRIVKVTSELMVMGGKGLHSPGVMSMNTPFNPNTQSKKAS